MTFWKFEASSLLKHFIRVTYRSWQDGPPCQETMFGSDWQTGKGLASCRESQLDLRFTGAQLCASLSIKIKIHQGFPHKEQGELSITKGSQYIQRPFCNSYCFWCSDLKWELWYGTTTSVSSLWTQSFENLMNQTSHFDDLGLYIQRNGKLLNITV